MSEPRAGPRIFHSEGVGLYPDPETAQDRSACRRFLTMLWSSAAKGARMNTVTPIRLVESACRQIGDPAKCAWCGERAKSAFEIYDPRGGCSLSVYAGRKPVARRRRKSGAGSARFSA